MTEVKITKVANGHFVVLEEDRRFNPKNVFVFPNFESFLFD